MRICTLFLAFLVAEMGFAQDAPNIILLIGDGMGLSQISAAIYHSDEPLNFEKFQAYGFIKTHSARQKVTDSAAGATAFSCGVKSYNGAIGVDADTVSQPTILEYYEKQGYATGVIATSTITHATPASFYAHVESRGMYEEIAMFLSDANVDYIAGGGLKHFNDRKDGLDLIEKMRQQGYEINTDTLGRFRKVSSGRKYLNLMAADAMPRMLDGRGDFLESATENALNYLSKTEKPFFLMVEGSQIDWGGHANELDYVVTELLDFNEVLGSALSFAEKNEHTLIIVTADHETGGLALAGGEDYVEIDYKFSTGGHTATLIPVFAFGKGSEKFNGIYQNNDIYHKMMEVVKGE